MTLLLSQALLWLLVLGLAAAVVALARQVGVLHERVTPVGALALSQGPQPGEAAPQVRALTLAGTTIVVGAPRSVAHLIMFVAPSCPICKQLIPTAVRFAKAEAVDILFAGDGEDTSHRAMAASHGIALDRFVNSSEVGLAYRVGKLPYAVLIDANGTIQSQGLVNTREHLESLITASKSNFNTIQDYMRDAHQRKTITHD